MTARRGLLSGLALALAAGCGGGGGDRAAGAGGSSKPLSALPAPMRLRDIAVIDALLQREYELIAAYTAGIPLLDEPGRLAAEQFLGQHLGHAGELAGWIKQARGKPSKPLAAYELGAPRTAPQMLTALHGHESGMIAAYLAAMPTLSPG
ncbi:MAG: hypothetical protein ABSG43_04415, partial [Solirubrobacteraceae bacterium]